MKFKSLLIGISISVLSFCASGATYYVSPEGAGSKDGSSFDNAFDIAAFTTQAGNNANGDIYYFAGGSYYIPTTVVFQVATGAYLYGNTDGERTVFTGDSNGNNNPESGDKSRLVRFQANTVDGNSTNAIVIRDIDFTCVYINNNNSSFTDSSNLGALVVDNSGDVLVENCRFYNNWSAGEQGGPAALLYRSTVKFVGCIFSNNKANYRGGAIRILSNANSKGITIFENCVIKNNINYHNLGGAIFASNFKSISIINSTIYGNEAQGGSGAAIYFNGYASGSSGYPRLLQIINSTIAGNTTGDVTGDGQIATTQSAHIYIANSVIPSQNGVNSIYFSGDAQTDKALISSGGWNYIGSVTNYSDANPEISWSHTDYYDESSTYECIFGENTINRDNVVLPATFVPGATGDEIEETITSATEDTDAAWNLPSSNNYKKDQLGNERVGKVTPGSVAMEWIDIDYPVSDWNTNSEIFNLIVKSGLDLYYKAYIGDATGKEIPKSDPPLTMITSIDLPVEYVKSDMSNDQVDSITDNEDGTTTHSLLIDKLINAADENKKSLNDLEEGQKLFVSAYSYSSTWDQKSDEILIGIGRNGTPTGIEKLILPSYNEAAFNIYGIRIDDSYKGVVIINGKKYIRR